MEEKDLLKRIKPFRFKDRFYKYGVELCNGMYPYYGGHTHWLVNILKKDYFCIGFCKLKFDYKEVYYDGNHCTLHFGFMYINWGGKGFFKYPFD